MSGIEIVILVAGGIYISKKVRERRERRKADAAVLESFASRHGFAQVVGQGAGESQPRSQSQSQNQRQQVGGEEDDLLPAYTPAVLGQDREGQAGVGTEREGKRDGDGEGGLPRYDEVEEVTAGTPQTTSGQMTMAVDAGSSDVVKKDQRRRWRIWRREKQNLG